MLERTVVTVRQLLGAFFHHNCPMHAAGLTYFSLLAIVPVLCCVLVLAKACRVDRYARDVINDRIDAVITQFEKAPVDELSRFAPLGVAGLEKKRIAAEEFAIEARHISNELFERIDGFDISTFGWVGFLLLLWTLVSSLGMVETSFNEIWDVPKPRPLWRRAYTYLFILIVLPVLATLAMSLPVMNIVKNVIVATLGASWLTRWAGEGLIWVLDWGLFRLALTWLLGSLFFAFVFWMMPHCRVRMACAFKGGLLTALFFGGWLKVCAVAQVGLARSSALYGSFAFLPIVLAWLYVSWQIVLLGAVVACHLQKKDQDEG